MSKAAQLMVKCLENEGVSVVFGIPGEENIRFVQALASSKSIRYVLTRHEQAAAFMAEMYGRVTGRAAVVSATLGPGAINMQLGVADATTNSTPMVAISAQVGQDREYKESHQYVDLVSMFAPITRWAAGVPTARAIPEMFRKAFKVAETERPAAVYLAVPEHIDADDADYDLTPLPRNVVRAEAPAPGQVERAVDILRKAKRPVVLAGHGAARADATEALVRFSEEFGIPVANTFHGKGVMPDDHPNSIGTIGFMRHDYVNFGFDNADVVIAVGYELQEFDPVRINPQADKQIIHIHRFPAEVDAHYSVDVGIIGDISASLDALTDALAGHGYEADPEIPGSGLLAEEFARGQQDSRYPLAPQRVVADTRAAMGRDDVVLVDTGATKMWMARLYPTYERNTCLISNGLSTMGFALPGALGVKLAQARVEGARRGGRRRIPDELAGDRDRRPGADTAGGADLGGRRLRPDRMEDGSRARRALLRTVRQPRRGDVRGKLWRQGLSDHQRRGAVTDVAGRTRRRRRVADLLPGRLLGESAADRPARRAGRDAVVRQTAPP